MTNALAVPAVNQWLASTLNEPTLQGLAPGGIHRGVAPENTPFPAVVYQNLSSVTHLVVGGKKLNVEMVFLVRGIDKRENYGGLVNIANRIDTLLHDAPPQAIPGGALEDCVQDSEFEQEDPPASGVIYTHLGARYRIHAQAP